jgi:hypothetical protein
MTGEVVQYTGLFLIGVLAGEELIVRYGIHRALCSLEDHAHLLVRQALVRRLRVMVPIVMLPAAALAAMVLVVVTGPGLAPEVGDPDRDGGVPTVVIPGDGADQRQGERLASGCSTT